MQKETMVLRLSEWLIQKASKIPRALLSGSAEFLGRAWFHFDARHREIALQNLDNAFGSQLSAHERRSIAKRNFIHLCRVIFEIPRVQALTRENLHEFVRFEGVHHIVSAVEKGKGALVLASHFGNWEMMAVAFALEHRPFAVIVRPLDNPVLNEMVNRLRSRTGNQTIPKKGSIRQLLRHLRQGDIVAILADQNVAWYEGVFVPFFDKICCTNKSMAVLALRTGKPVVPVYNYREPDGRYCIVFEPEVEITRTGDATVDIEENTARLNRVIEQWVRRHPEQWFWVHQRWKTKPWQPWPRHSEAIGKKS